MWLEGKTCAYDLSRRSGNGPIWWGSLKLTESEKELDFDTIEGWNPDELYRSSAPAKASNCITASGRRPRLCPILSEGD